MNNVIVGSLMLAGLAKHLNTQDKNNSMTDGIPRQFVRTYTIASGIAASATQDVGIKEKDAQQYGPFTLANIVNFSGQKLLVYPDGDANKALPVGNSYDKVYTDLSFNSLIIKNLDASNATDNTIYVTIQTDVSTRQFLKLLAATIRKPTAEPTGV